MSLLAADRAVSCVAFREHFAAPDVRVLPSRAACAKRVYSHQFSIPVGDDEASMTVSFSDAEVIAAVDADEKVTFGVITVILLVSLSTASIGFRFIVGTRLRRLRAAIHRITETGERVPVTASGG
jgi:hypothetical protein